MTSGWALAVCTNASRARSAPSCGWSAWAVRQGLDRRGRAFRFALIQQSRGEVLWTIGCRCRTDRLDNPTGRADVPVEQGLDGWFRLQAYELVYHLALVDEQDGRNAPDLEMRRQLRLLLGVDLGKDEAAFVVVCNTIEQRHQRAAGAAPGGPEIDEDGLRVRGLHHVGHEVGNGGNDFLCGFRHGRHPGSLNGKFSRAAGPTQARFGAIAQN